MLDSVARRMRPPARSQSNVCVPGRAGGPGSSPPYSERFSMPSAPLSASAPATAPATRRAGSGYGARRGAESARRAASTAPATGVMTALLHSALCCPRHRSSSRRVHRPRKARRVDEALDYQQRVSVLFLPVVAEPPQHPLMQYDARCQHQERCRRGNISCLRHPIQRSRGAHMKAPVCHPAAPATDHATPLRSASRGLQSA